ncbi:S24/S26 family peptidase [Halorussus litoreus]|uniref:S26 family signal peptidase n=1 Tax=Halorussus litoreus TaxID=1710536 RepID=UPI000E283A91|nr:S26 family signal peptidase [Halorussus litoreus]
MSSPRDGSSSDDAAPDGDEATDGSLSSSDRPPDDSERPTHEFGTDDPESAPNPQYPDGGEQADAGIGPLALVRRFRNSEHGAVVFVREMLSSAAIVLVIGLVLFAISGVWPPMVAIESGSMEPHMQKGDLVFIMEEGRLAPEAAQGDTGIVTAHAGADAGYNKFNNPGDVIVYKPDGKSYETPIIHRAIFWVEEGENWYDEADQQYIGAGNCQELSNCPAPHAGFITKGDNNGFYDQASSRLGDISSPVKPSWVRGTAEVRVPWLGWVRLKFSGAASLAPGLGPAGVVNPSPAAA